MVETIAASLSALIGGKLIIFLKSVVGFVSNMYVFFLSADVYCSYGLPAGDFIGSF